MISRRQVLVASGGGLAAALASPGNAAATEARLALFLFDPSVRGAAAAAETAGRAGVALAEFRGDIGVPWLELLDPMWRAGPQPIAGVTDSGALFCLEQLGRSHGVACTLRLPVSGRGAAAAQALLRAAADSTPLRRPTEIDSAPVAWLMQPVGSRK